MSIVQKRINPTINHKICFMKYFIIFLFLFFGCSKTKEISTPPTTPAAPKTPTPSTTSTPPTTPVASATPVASTTPTTPTPPTRSVDAYYQVLCYITYITLRSCFDDIDCTSASFSAKMEPRIKSVLLDADNNLTDNEIAELGSKLDQMSTAEESDMCNPTHLCNNNENLNAILQSRECRTEDWESAHQLFVNITGESIPLW